MSLFNRLNMSTWHPASDTCLRNPYTTLPAPSKFGPQPVMHMDKAPESRRLSLVSLNLRGAYDKKFEISAKRN